MSNLINESEKINVGLNNLVALKSIFQPQRLPTKCGKRVLPISKSTLRQCLKRPGVGSYS